MLLDVGVSVTNVADKDYDDSNDAFTPYAEENMHDFENVYVENIVEETILNYNDDVSKVAINDILNEMRMSSPIKNDLINDVLVYDGNKNYHQYENGDHEGPAVNPNEYYNYDFNQNYYFKEEIAEDITNDDSPLDELYPVTCSTPDVQGEFNDGIKFQYDASDQFNCEPNIRLTYREEIDSTEAAAHGSNVLCFGNSLDTSNQTNYEHNATASQEMSNNQYFECSTNLPMTPEELQDDIQKYLNNQQNYNYTASYGYTGNTMVNDTIYMQDSNELDLTYNNNMFDDYIGEQTELFQNSGPENPTESFEPYNMSPSEEPETFQCTFCQSLAFSLKEFTSHMRMHSDINLNCTECKFTAKRASKIKQHQRNGHGARCCQTCDYVAHSSSKIRSHMRRH